MASCALCHHLLSDLRGFQPRSCQHGAQAQELDRSLGRRYKLKAEEASLTLIQGRGGAVHSSFTSGGI